ncbi:MAG TPA: PKD domain-containing protein [Candidatus Binataceae bacterium]|nr:PKD domain-containing protein [Candidatus Binataceae bacterium]
MPRTLINAIKLQRLRIIVGVGAIMLLGLGRMPCASAQESDSNGGGNGPAAMSSSASDQPDDNPAPMAKVPILQPITGSMMVSPPYGNAPLKVGFFVLANDPEDVGFLTYQWNFGDGTVSSLPPELYIFHTYANPGNYVCSLVIKTADGRSQTFFQGVIVKAVS